MVQTHKLTTSKVSLAYRGKLTMSSLDRNLVSHFSFCVLLLIFVMKYSDDTDSPIWQVMRLRGRHLKFCCRDLISQCVRLMILVKGADMCYKTVHIAFSDLLRWPSTWYQSAQLNSFDCQKLRDWSLISTWQSSMLLYIRLRRHFRSELCRNLKLLF